MQGNDESTAVAQYKEKYEEVMVYLFGFVSGVLVMFGGRYAEPLVICVEVATQVDLLAYDEELVDDLNARLLQPEEATLTGLVKKENLEMWVHRAQHAHVGYVMRRGSRRC